MHIGAIMVFDPLPGGDLPSLEQLSTLVERRLGGLPRYRAPPVGGPNRRRALAGLGARCPISTMHRHIRRAVARGPGGRPSWRPGPNASSPSGSTARAAVGDGRGGRPGGRPLGDRLQDPPLHGRRRRLGRCRPGPARRRARAARRGRSRPRASAPRAPRRRHGSWWGCDRLRFSLSEPPARASTSRCIRAKLVDAAQRARATAELLVRDEVSAAPALAASTTRSARTAASV